MDEAGRKGYMRTLLEQAERQSGLLGPAFGKSPVYRRIRNILGYRKPGKVLGILAAGGLAVAGIGLVTSPESAAKSVAIIGGADGPTSIFLAGKTGSGMEDGLEKLEEFYGKLKNVMEELPDDFMMIHQSYIVNQLYVSEYAYDCVKMSDGTVLSISKPYRKEIRGKIKQYRRAEIYGEL